MEGVYEKKIICDFSSLRFNIFICTLNVNVENSGELSCTTLGIDSLIEIGNELWYDSTTRIVYWWNGNLVHYRSDTTPTACYAPNGLPYRYDPRTNTFEEI